MKLQHWLIITLMAHYHPTFLQLLSFTSLHSPKSSHEHQLKIPRKMSRCLDIAVSTIRPLLSGNCFHLHSISHLLLPSKQTSKPTSLYCLSIIPNNSSGWPVQWGRGEREESLCVCAFVCLYLKRENFSRLMPQSSVFVYLSIYKKVWMYVRCTGHYLCVYSLFFGVCIHVCV